MTGEMAAAGRGHGTRGTSWDKAMIWYTHNEHNTPWRAGIVVSCSCTVDDWIFQIDDLQGGVVQITTLPLDKHCLEFVHVKKRDENQQLMKDITDMTSLSFLNEPEMIECLRLRYDHQIIYTSIGPILIAVNPFEQLDHTLYSTETIKKYANSDPSTSRQYGPHVFQVSSTAYKKMFIDKYDANKRENQAILVNGESGAGKTESTKQVLRYLAVTSSELAKELGVDDETDGDIEALINAVNPITESFGNAKTLRNNNSSRFGKFIELCYSGSGYIIGAHIQTYLLETIRVISQIKGERNYHIFYEVFIGLTEDQRSEWCCHDLTVFHYLNQSQEYKRYDGESDFDTFSRVIDALRTINLSMGEITWILQIIVAILHLGNILFVSSQTVGDDAALLSPQSLLHINQVCQLLSIDETALSTAFTKRGIKVAGNYILKNLNSESAIVARDTFAKTLYDLLFKTLLSFINSSLSLDKNSKGDEQASSIGVLDIFGFEYFEKNSFEQLCINFANEKLQDHFNHSIFKSEQEVYQEEGIKWNFTNYPDNSDRLELFEHKRTGIFLMCDEQLKIPKPSDEKLVKSFYAKCVAHPHFSANKAEQIKNEFVINHFACVVKYQIEGFVDKNRNDVGQEVFDCLELSNSDFIRNLLLQCDDKSYLKRLREAAAERNSLEMDLSRERANSKVKSQQKASITKRTVSVISQFSSQLNELISKIRSMRSHFIRCIKPNNALLARTFDYQMVQTQFRCGGALGAVQVFHAGFPNRMDFKYFVTRYTCFLTVCGTNILTQDLLKCIQTAKSTGSDDLWRAATSMLLDIISLTIMILYKTEGFNIPEDIDVVVGLQMGKTQVFLRAPVFEFLERLQYQSQVFIAKILQRRRRALLLERKFNASNAISGTKLICNYYASRSYLYIVSKRRFQARNCISATIILQRKIRVFLAVTHRKRVIKGFTKLKACYRGNVARKFVYEIKRKSATQIQTKYRQFIATKCFRKLKADVILVQKYLRRFLAEKNKSLKLKVILKLQCLWRGTMARIRTVAYRQKLKQAALEAQRRAAEAKADFMANLDEKLKSNPNLLFDMLGASEKIALLSRQNEALLHANRMMDMENTQLRETCNQLQIEISDLKSTIPVAVQTISKVEDGSTRRNVEDKEANVVSVSNAILIPTSETDNQMTRYLHQILFLAKQGEKELCLSFDRIQLELEDNQRTLQENEAILARLTSDSEHLNHRMMELENDSGSTSRPPLDRGLSLPSIFGVSESGSTQQRFGSLGRLASRLSIVGSQQSQEENSNSEDKLDINHDSAEVSSDAQRRLNELSESLTQINHEISSQQMRCAELKEKISGHNKNHTNCSKNINSLRQIILFLEKSQDEESNSGELMPNTDALWAMKNLNMKNAALAEELRSVKHRFSAVIGRMEGFSLSKFTMNVLGGEHSPETPEKSPLESSVEVPSTEIPCQPEVAARAGGESNAFDDTPVEMLFPSPPPLTECSAMIEETPLEVKEFWKPSFVCAVSQWSRKTRRDIVFILRVRHVGMEDIRDWSVIKTFADFKALRLKLKQYISGHVDMLFPPDGMTLFSISDDLAEERKEALNSYIVALCSGSNISLGDPACELIEEFLCVDEFVNMDRIFARDAGLIITTKEINLLG